VEESKKRNRGKLQLWDANDFEHRLKKKLLDIIITLKKVWRLKFRNRVEYKQKLLVNTI
jgi:hypothetical protein